MAKVKWEDDTSYTQGESRSGSNKPEPRQWRLGKEHRAGLLLHRHRDMPGTWFLTCYDLGIEQHDLSNTDLEKAKVEALAYVQKRVKSMVEYYKRLGIPL
jgi:hypothetical protein